MLIEAKNISVTRVLFRDAAKTTDNLALKCRINIKKIQLTKCEYRDYQNL